MMKESSGNHLRTILTLFLLLLNLLLPADRAAAAPAPGPQAPSAALWVVNDGQAAPTVRYLAAGPGGQAWLTDDGLWLSVIEAAPQRDAESLRRRQRERLLLPGEMPQGTVLHIGFAGANPAPALQPEAPAAAAVSYLHGADPAGWRAAVPAWGAVRYVELYPGVDLVVGGDPAGAAWRLEARAGAPLADVKLRVAGAQDAVIDETGALRLTLGRSTVTLALPELVAAPASGATGVNAAPAALAAPAVTRAGDVFEVAAPFAGAPFAGAPFAGAPVAAAPDAGAGDLLFSTLRGGTNGWERGHNIAVDAAGNSYVVGETLSTNFPVTTGAFDAVFQPGDFLSEAFVMKLSPDGTQLLYATYLGGNDLDTAWGVAVVGDSAYVVGDTYSTDFPGAPPIGNQGETDVFLVKLNATGTAADLVRLYGDAAEDYGYDVAVANGLIHIVGSHIPSDAAGNAVVAQYNAAGVQQWRTEIGGMQEEDGYDLVVGAGGVIHMVGEGWSTSFPGGGTAGLADVLYARLSSAGAIQAQRLLGGAGDDFGDAIALDATGQVYLTGGTESTGFPGALNARPGLRDAFVARLDASANVVFAVYLGGAGYDEGLGLGVDPAGSLVVTGRSDSANFPTTPDAYDPTPNGGMDAFVAQLQEGAAAANRVTYATMLGGAAGDEAHALALLGSSVYITGITESSGFPKLAGETLKGMEDVFVARFALPGAPLAPALSIAVGPNPANALLSWNTTGAATYRLWRSLAPYFTPGDGSSPTPLVEQAGLTHTDPGVLTDPASHYYVVTGVAGAQSSPPSNRVGEFTYTLTPGAP